MSSLYLYHDYRINTVGALAPISEVVGGQQRLTKDAAKAIHLLLSNKLALPVGSAMISNGQVVPLPGYDPSVDADIVTYKFFVASPTPENAGNVLTKAENVMLVDTQAAQANIFGTPTDLTVVVTKNAAVASMLSQAGAPLAVLVPFDQAVTQSAKEEKKGIQPIAIVGAIAGGAVGFLVGGPVGAAIGAIGTGVLVQQVAA